jgi:hypothetical protein
MKRKYWRADFTVNEKLTRAVRDRTGPVQAAYL